MRRNRPNPEALERARADASRKRVEAGLSAYALRPGDHSFDLYTPPMLDGQKLYGEPEHLDNMQAEKCVCCAWCAGSICNDPSGPALCFEHEGH